MKILPDAMAVRFVSSFAETSTMTALPSIDMRHGVVHLDTSIAEPAVGEGAGLALQAEPAVSEGGEIVGCDGNPRHETGKQDVEDRPLGIHDAARKTQDRHIAEVGHEEHRSRKDGSPVTHNPRPAVPDGLRRPVSGSTLMPPVQRTISSPSATACLMQEAM